MISSPIFRIKVIRHHLNRFCEPRLGSTDAFALQVSQILKYVGHFNPSKSLVLHLQNFSVQKKLKELPQELDVLGHLKIYMVSAMEDGSLRGLSHVNLQSYSGRCFLVMTRHSQESLMSESCTLTQILGIIAFCENTT